MSGRRVEAPLPYQKENSMSTKLGDVAAAVGKGLFAGAAGTVAMTASSTIEMKLRGPRAGVPSGPGLICAILRL
jgi:hypothetical protein